MSRHPSGIQLRSTEPRVLEARAALERLHVVLDAIALDADTVDLVFATRSLWTAMVFDLAELQEDDPSWPSVDEMDLERMARRAANRYEAFVAPLIDFDPRAPRANADIREAIGRVIDALDVYVDLTPQSVAG